MFGHILWGYSLKFRPYIGLIYGRYLQFRFLKWPLIFKSPTWTMFWREARDGPQPQRRPWPNTLRRKMWRKPWEPCTRRRKFDKQTMVQMEPWWGMDIELYSQWWFVVSMMFNFQPLRWWSQITMIPTRNVGWIYVDIYMYTMTCICNIHII